MKNEYKTQPEWLNIPKDEDGVYFFPSFRKDIAALGLLDDLFGDEPPLEHTKENPRTVQWCKDGIVLLYWVDKGLTVPRLEVLAVGLELLPAIARRICAEEVVAVRGIEPLAQAQKNRTNYALDTFEFKSTLQEAAECGVYSPGGVA